MCVGLLEDDFMEKMEPEWLDCHWQRVDILRKEQLE